MSKNILVKKVTEIEMPDDMQQRIIRNCRNEMEKKTVKNTNTFFKRPTVAVASFALCLCLAGVSALAATGKLEGHFKDIKNWNGAVVGTSYEQATDEVELNAIDATDELTVELIMLKPNDPPYSIFQTFGIEEYKIVDANGNTVIENEILEMPMVDGSTATVKIPLNDISEGTYKLVVSKLIGGAKAEQPLVLSGNWECEFAY